MRAAIVAAAAGASADPDRVPSGTFPNLGAGLLGIRLFVQAWTSDPGANSLGVVVSNAGEAVIGRN